jgi:hypothetical protein
MDKSLLYPSVGKTFFDEKHLPFKKDTDFLRKPVWMAYGFHKTYVPSFDEIYGEKIYSIGDQENGQNSSAARPVEFQHKNTHPANNGSVDPSTWKENQPGSNTDNANAAGNNTNNNDTSALLKSEGLVIESKVKKHAGLIIVVLLALILLVLIIKN